MHCPACKTALPAAEVALSAAERKIGGKNIVCPACGAVLWITPEGGGSSNIGVDLPLVVVVGRSFPDDDDIIKWQNLTRH